jgi:hypothetical protein
MRGGGSVLLKKGREWGGREKEGRRRAVPVLNGVWRWGKGRRGGATRQALRRGPDTMVGSGGRPVRGPRPADASGGGTGVPLSCVPARTREK